MLNPHLTADLRQAERVFRKRGQPNLASACRTARGALTDSMNPDETDARRLLELAFA